MTGPQMNHVNLGVLPDGVPELSTFLVDVLGYVEVELDDLLRSRGAMWFDAADGTQIHLSRDPEHRPAAMAHVALDLGDDLAAVRERLAAREVEMTVGETRGTHVVLCRDPAGNRWELRGRLPDA
jgi:hypothetical protein